ncbi:hypothetical protein ABID19_002199 [Mesorhizobium robiniae]|uniref:Uncharacterized protein n=1 Tax=Mesorhizobium robiniae TaxID=559315 RepID=A0ABV2GM03_9HYPH
MQASYHKGKPRQDSQKQEHEGWRITQSSKLQVASDSCDRCIDENAERNKGEEHDQREQKKAPKFLAAGAAGEADMSHFECAPEIRP